jgi:hypothetical protein
MLRRLLNIASIVCLVACVALMGMWVRSYRAQDEFRALLWGNRVVIVDSLRGRTHSIECLADESLLGRFWPWSIGGRPMMVDDGDKTPYSTPKLVNCLGFGATVAQKWISVGLPFWFLVFSSGSLAVICRLRWPPQFTLRGLFIATTFLAVVLGMNAWLDRAWIGK